MIKLFQYHKFRELFLIEQNVEVKMGQQLQATHFPVAQTQLGEAVSWNAPEGPVFFDTMIYTVQANKVDVISF